jgi:serine/threonine protein kinase
LLTLCRLIEKNPRRPNEFPFDDELIGTFRQVWSIFVQDEVGLPEYPFYHLRTSKFWNHKIRNGKEDEYKQHQRFPPKRIREIIEYGYLEDKYFKLMRNEIKRKELIESLKKKIQESVLKKQVYQGKKDQTQEVESLKPRYGEIQSPLPHERQALEQIFDSLRKYVELIPNYDLHDPSTNQYLECDLIIISTAKLAVVELKHWSGAIDIGPQTWTVNGRTRKDPHKVNNHKCKVLKSWAEKKFPFYAIPYVESIVVLTNPDAEITGASNPSTDKKNPTFSGVHALSQFFIPKLSASSPPITKKEVQNIAEELRRESAGERKCTMNLVGYETLENLTESPHKIEILARPIDVGLDRQRVHRLRLFTVDSSLPPEERERQRSVFYNSLKALITLGDHPNILRVWSLPSEEGVIIEASEWSDDGTLADVMRKRGALPFDKAAPLLRGILEGLRAVHDQGMVHRDLVPENILVVNGVPKLMNFDMTYIPEDKRRTVLAADAKLPPSPYRAPEIYARQPFSKATDLFSVGAMAFRILCGKPPFESGSDLLAPGWELSDEARNAMLEAAPPAAVVEMILQLLKPERLARHQEAAEVLAALNRLSGTPAAEATPPIPEETNRVLRPEEKTGIYLIERFLDQGREAQVYLARQGKERRVALKLFNHDIAYDRANAEQRVLKEAQSPYVVRCETMHQWNDGRFFLVLDYVSGLSLREIIGSRELPDLETFRKVSRSLMEALTVLHRKQEREPLLHKDLKPENILLPEKDRPVIIDFGEAGPPRLGPFAGTEGYVAPDLFRGAEYEFCESGDLFALGVTLFEWLCGERPYQSAPTLTDQPRNPGDLRDDLPAELIDWLLRAVQPLRDDRFPNILKMREEFCLIFLDPAARAEVGKAAAAEKPEQPAGGVSESKGDPQGAAETVSEEDAEAAAETAEIPSAAPPHRNPFVGYLNTLHNTKATNEGALAETQACSPYFGAIHVSLPLTEILLDHLIAEDGGHVILTGHAGDGKSTIGLEIFKRLKGMLMSESLSAALKLEETVDYKGLRVHIVKDMSELTEADRRAAMERMFKAGAEERFLLISNTGMLLETLRGFARDFGHVPDEVEDHLLERLQEREPCALELFDSNIRLVNLTQVDNIAPAAGMFRRMVKAPHWSGCDPCDIETACPIRQNRQILLDKPERVAERVAWVYRRLFEYGQRLTLRQIAAHLAYSLTSGMDCDAARRRLSGPVPPKLNRFLFHNRFFGFKGGEPDANARRLMAVRYLVPLEMGARPFPNLDRKLWTSETGLPPDFPPRANKVFKELRRDEGETAGAAARRRQEIRRLFYLFSQPEPAFFPVFLNSSMLVELEFWQADETKLNPIRREELRRKILHVLQEQFTGFHVPDRAGNNTLFITLSRRNEDLRQSVQLLLARVPFDNFHLDFDPIYRLKTLRRFQLRLRDKNHPRIALDLDLPFLDFVMNRSAGRVGGRLNRAYLDRLERFKELLRRQYAIPELTLLEFTADGNFKPQRIQAGADSLQVY